MNTYTTKLRHILPVFLYVTIGSVLGLALIRYFLSVQYHIIDIKQEIWQIWIPLAFPWIPITIWLRPRFRILTFKKDTDRKQFAFQFFAWFIMMVPLFISQDYITKASGTLTEVQDIANLNETTPSRFYRISEFETLPSYGSNYVDVRSSGKHNQYLDFKFYFVCPIGQHSINPRPSEYKYWYGVMFKTQISNRGSIAEKERKYERFVEDCVSKIENYNYQDLTYFERLPNSDDRDHYFKALESATSEAHGESVILEPKHDLFENRAGNKFAWIFWSYSIGLGFFLLILAWPRLSKTELQRQRAGRKPKEDDVIEMLKYLIPREPHFATSVILDLNILVFLIMLFDGVPIMHPNGVELMAWGANRRPETIDGEWWRLISSMFVHGGIAHLIFNIFGLVLAATFLEPMLGTIRYSIVYLLSGISGSIASIVWNENAASVGASGAIFGLFGAILSLVLTDTLHREVKKVILWLFGLYAGINLVIGLFGGIDNAAHIGGLICGGVIGLIMWKTTSSDPVESLSNDE